MTLLWCSSKFAQLYELSLCNKINIQPFLVEYLLASERSERDTLSRSSMENAIRIYIYIARCQVVVKFYRDLYFGYSPP